MTQQRRYTGRYINIVANIRAASPVSAPLS
jgi:hypothetical protein